MKALSTQSAAVRFVARSFSQVARRKREASHFEAKRIEKNAVVRTKFMLDFIPFLFVALFVPSKIELSADYHLLPSCPFFELVDENFVSRCWLAEIMSEDEVAHGSSRKLHHFT